MRRSPIADPAPAASAVGQPGQHRPEVVAERLAAQILSPLTHLRRLEQHMPPTFDAVLARLDAVVAAAPQLAQDALDQATAAVEQRVAALEAVFGITPVDPAPADPPAVDPTV